MNIEKTVRFTITLMCVNLLFSAHGAPIEEYDWRKSETNSFNVFSTLSDNRSIDLIRNLELFRRAVLSTQLIDTVESKISTDIYILRRGSDFRKLGRDNSVSGLFIPGLRNNFILIKGSSRIDKNVAVLHEYTHYLLNDAPGPNYPLWFEEGFAQLLSNTDETKTNLILGAPSDALLAHLDSNKWLRLSDVLSATEFTNTRRNRTAMLYAQSWLITSHIVHLDNFAARLGQYLAGLEQGMAYVQAFEQAFGLNEGELNLALKARIRNQDFEFENISKTIIGDFSPTLTPMTSAEISLRLGQLALRFGELENAQHWFTLAEQDDDHNTSAHSGLGDIQKFKGNFKEAEKHFSIVAERNDRSALNVLDVAEFWHRRAVVSKELDNQIAFMGKAQQFYAQCLTLNDQIPELHVQYGLSFIFNDDKERALEHFKLAETLLPGNLSIRLLLAESLLDAGQVLPARTKAQSIVNAAHTSTHVFKRAAAILEDAD